MWRSTYITDTLLIGQTLGFGAGLVMSALLLALLMRGPVGQSGKVAKYLQGAASLLWNLGGLLGAMLSLFGLAGHTNWMIAASLLNADGASLFPISFLALWQRPRDEKTLRAKACLWLCGIAYTNTAIISVLFLAHAMGWGLPSHGTLAGDEAGWIIGKVLALHVALVTLAGALLLLRGRLQGFAAKFYATTTLIGALTPAVVSLLVRGTAWCARHNDVVTIVEEQTPLLILLGAVVYFGDFRFSNVYVKLSLRFLAALLLALSFCLLACFTLPRWMPRLTAYPTAGLVLAGTALLTGAFLLFVWRVPKMNRMVDQRLFRQPNYETAAKKVWKELSACDDPERLLQLAAALAKETLALESARVLPLSSLPADPLAPLLNGGEVCEVKRCDALREALGPEVDFLAPVRVKGKPAHVIAVAPGAQRRTLLDSELNFLRALAGQASSRLDALTFEKERLERKSREERLLRQVTEAELRALRAQINPHFLFNSLNTVADLIVADPPRAERMTVQLARIFRHVLSGSNRQMVSVAEEIDFLKTWLEIEAVRFGDRLRVRFEVDEAAEPLPVPSLILQPLVENALKHGLAPKIDGGTLRIEARIESEGLRLRVEDDGMGFDAPRSNGAVKSEGGNGVGLRNVAERLATVYAGRAHVAWEPIPTGGCRVTLRLPRAMEAAR